MKNLIIASLLTLTLSSCGSESPKPTATLEISNDLYATEFNASSDSILYNMDADTGEVTSVGTIAAQITDIALMNGQLFGVSFSDLYLIDPANANVSLIGATGHFDVNALGSFAGLLYAATTSGDLLILNTSTGNATLSGIFGSNLTSSGDLAFNSLGELFATVNVPVQTNDSLARINTSTGTATIIGDAGADKIFGIAFFNNQLYGTTFNGTLVTIDTSTGASTNIGQGKAFIDRSSEFVNSNALNIGGLTTQ